MRRMMKNAATPKPQTANIATTIPTASPTFTDEELLDELPFPVTGIVVGDDEEFGYSTENSVKCEV